jgi:hypothetical protein
MYTAPQARLNLAAMGCSAVLACHTVISHSSAKEMRNMPEFMDVHRGMTGITAEDLRDAHNADLAIQGEEGVEFKQAWADPSSGVVYCLSEAGSAEAVQRVHEKSGHPADEIHPVPLRV